MREQQNGTELSDVNFTMLYQVACYPTSMTLAEKQSRTGPEWLGE